MRVFMGLAEVSGFYSNLKKGFDVIGVEAELVTLTTHRFQYRDTNSSIWVRMAQTAVARRDKAHQSSKPIRLFWQGATFLTRVILFIWALLRFDVFLFGCGTSFFRFHELPILKFFGKTVIYNFHGTDGRPGFMDGFAEDLFLPPALRNGTGYIPPFQSDEPVTSRVAKLEGYRAITQMRKNNVDRINKYADLVIDSPSHGQHHSKPFLQRSIVGMPYWPDQDLIRQARERAPNDKIVILHSPSYPEGKGTPQIRKAISAVEKKGYSIEFVEITGRPNREVLELITQCDFVIDQLYSDMPMVGFATEAAFLGKPAIVGGYYSQNLPNDLAKEWLPPTLFCLPEDIETAIEKMITDKEFRAQLGHEAQNYVNERWRADHSAQRLIQIFEGDYPQDWLFDPANCDYVLGMGMPKHRLQQIIHELYERFGDAVFGFSDKPELLNKLVEFGKGWRPDDKLPEPDKK